MADGGPDDGTPGSTGSGGASADGTGTGAAETTMAADTTVAADEGDSTMGVDGGSSGETGSATDGGSTSDGPASTGSSGGGTDTGGTTGADIPGAEEHEACFSIGMMGACIANPLCVWDAGDSECEPLIGDGPLCALWLNEMTCTNSDAECSWDDAMLPPCSAD